ncbi:type II secretion system protein [bacterium]|nr:type II secretion system protein [bacterium]
MIKKFLAFTLSEILIALSVIGVVAVLVIPQLIAGQRASQAKAQFSSAYSLMSKAIADMDADDVAVNANAYATNTFFEKFKPYNRFTVDCGALSTSSNTSVCPKRSSDTIYKLLGSNKLFPGTLMDDGGLVLNNGMLVAIENHRENATFGPNHNIWILVDINGMGKNPNILGYDLFIFQLTDNGELLPLGAPGTDTLLSETKDPKNCCCIERINPGCSADGTYNGYTCAYFATTDEDYFKKLYKGY